MTTGTAKLKIACPSCRQRMDLSDLDPFTRILCPSCESEIIVPKPFGSLMLEELIGQGAIAHVYRALDQTLDREVAVKIQDLAETGNLDVIERFLSAARRSALLTHPNTIPIFSCGEAEGKPYVVMQYMGKGSLAARIGGASPKLPTSFSLQQLLAAAKGLAAAHGNGVCHHDFNPANILTDIDENTKVGDFGLGGRDDHIGSNSQPGRF